MCIYIYIYTRNLAQFQGVKDHSQVSTPCYTAKQDSVADQEEDSNSQDSLKPPSPSGSDFRNPIQQESEYDHQLLVLTKEFVPNMDMLEKEFNSEENRVKREAYRANHTKEQKIEVLEKWKLFMKEVKADYPFFEYFEKHFQWHKKNCVISKTKTKPRHLPKVNVLEAHLSSSSSNEPSSENEKEKEPLDDQLGDTPPLPPKKWKSKYRGNPAFKDFHRKKIHSKEYRRQKLFKNNDFYRKGNPNPIENLKPKAKGKCFKCGKRGHFKKECPGKSPTHSLVFEDISKALELDQPENGSPNSSVDREICQIYQDSSSPRVPDSTSSSPDEVFFRTFCSGFCKNSRVRKSGILFWVPVMNSMSKPKTERMACQRAKICFDAMF